MATVLDAAVGTGDQEVHGEETMKGESPETFYCPLFLEREYEGWHFWMPCLASLSASATRNSSHTGFITVRVSKRHALGQHIRTVHSELSVRERSLVMDTLDDRKPLAMPAIEG